MYVPFDYQTECLQKLKAARVARQGRSLITIASGLGKTVTSAFDVQTCFSEEGHKRFLYLCHQNEILNQACATFKSILGADRRYGFFHGLEKSAHRADCLFASLQTMRKHHANFRPDEFDYVVVDESHHTSAETYLSVIGYWKPKFLLGMTATPDRRDGRNIRSVYGNEVYYLPLEEALVRNLVTPVDYRLMTDEISFEGIRNRESDLLLQNVNDRVFELKRDEEIAAIIARHSSEFQTPRTIIFASTIARAEQLTKSIRGSVTIHSRVPSKERIVRIEMFRVGMIQTVITVDCFNEGVDIPEANVIVFLRSTASPVIFFQQLGRGLRRYDGKEKVLVLDFVGNHERVTMLKEFAESIKRKQNHGSDQVLANATSTAFGLNLPGTFTIKFDEKALELLKVIQRIRPKRIADTPELLKEYSTRNLQSASHLSATTSRELWWTCSVCGYEYQMSSRLKLSGKHCPKCESQVTEFNNLAFLQPDLTKEYSIRNPLTADKIKATSREVVLWSCGQCGYDFKARPRSRIYRGDGCPQCSSLITFYKWNLAFRCPEVSGEYSDVNILSPNRIHFKSKKVLWWICEVCGHNWQASAALRSDGGGVCPACSPKVATKTNNLVMTHPHLAEEYSSRNRKPVETAFGESDEILWWLCFECGHYWQATSRERLSGARCPFCRCSGMQSEHTERHSQASS